jgi:hypothetical protein
MPQSSPLADAQHKADVLRDSGEIDAARTLLSDALEVARPALGEAHPEILSAAHHLARLHREAGNPAAARRALEGALAAGQRRFGDDHPLLLAIFFDLGAVAEELGNRHEARRNFGRVAAAGPSVLGEDHWTVRAARDYLADTPPPTGHTVDAGPLPRVPAGAPPVPTQPVQPPHTLDATGVLVPAQPPPPEAAPRPTPAVAPTPAAVPGPGPTQAGAGLQPTGLASKEPPSGAEAYPVQPVSRLVPYPTIQPQPTTQPAPPVRGWGAIVAAVAATIAAIAATVAAVAATDAPAPAPAPAQASAGPTLSGAPPSAVRLRDNGAAVTVSWTDPSAGAVPFIVVGGRSGQTLGALATIKPGETSYTVNGLNPRLGYCFAVLAVYSTDTYATSGQVCTTRGRPSPR